VALGECKRAAADNEGCIEMIENALTTKKLSPKDEARALTFLGSAYSELEGQTEKSLECFEKAIAMRTKLFSNGAEHFSVAEVYLDVAAEYHELGQHDKTVESLEKCIPYLNLPSSVLDVQFAWLKKALELSGMSSEEAQERYRSVKRLRKLTDKSRKKLPAPIKEKAAVQASFLPPPPKKNPKKKNNNKKK
jgi:tetratricopeptide (TPR) repeat protein